jgi:diacylglycerol kinase (ATP)
MAEEQKVYVIINPKSGLRLSLTSLMRSIQKHWDVDGSVVSYQLSKSADDGRSKTRRAIDEGASVVLVVGGDGMVNSIGEEVMNTPAAMAVIPTGSGNGFARHFDIPLTVDRAVKALANGREMSIDVGTANGRPFFVTCSMAWDANVVKGFEKSPVRGVVPYLFAAASEYLDFEPQAFHVTLDGDRQFDIPDPLVFTVANLTQYGGGAEIAPSARPDDGLLDLIALRDKDGPRAIPHLFKLLEGKADKIPGVITHTFKALECRRGHPSPIQVDGELLDAGTVVKVEVLPKALRVIVP